MDRRIAGMIVCIGVWISGLSAGEMLQKGSAPVSIDTPKWTLTGKPAHLSGKSLPKIGKVKLEIVYPSQRNDPYTNRWVLNVPVQDTGLYRIDFKETKKAGKYNITAWAPDKKRSVQTILHVANGKGFGKHMTEQFIGESKLLLDTIVKKIPSLEEKLSLIPQSPATEEIKHRLNEISGRLAEGISKIEELKEPYRQIEKFVNKNPDSMDIFSPIFESMGESAWKMEEERMELEEKFRRFASRKPNRCDDIDMIASGLEFVSGSMQTLLLLYDFSIKAMADQALELYTKTQLSNNKNLPGAKSSLPDSEILLGKSVLKTAIAGTANKKAWVKDSVGLVNSTVGYLAGKLLGVYCEKYTGDFDALFVAQYYAYNRKWWSYSITLKGKLNLRYEKGTGPIRVSGEFEGNAEKFLVWDDLMAATPEMNRYVAFHVTLPPTASVVPGAQETGKVLANEFGKMGRYGFGPYAFLVPVHGIIDGKKMMLEVDKPVKDYGDNVKGIAWYILVEPSMPIPYVMTADLPMVKAGFILSRGLRGKATFDVGIDKKRSTISKVFHRTVKADNGEYKVNWEVKVKACNPECLK